MWCRQFRQNFVCMRATWNLMRRKKKHEVQLLRLSSSALRGGELQNDFSFQTSLCWQHVAPPLPSYGLSRPGLESGGGVNAAAWISFLLLVKITFLPSGLWSRYTKAPTPRFLEPRLLHESSICVNNGKPIRHFITTTWIIRLLFRLITYT
jgi:hypothetical protein